MAITNFINRLNVASKERQFSYTRRTQVTFKRSEKRLPRVCSLVLNKGNIAWMVPSVTFAFIYAFAM